jgi:hypothetical protein
LSLESWYGQTEAELDQAQRRRATAAMRRLLDGIVACTVTPPSVVPRLIREGIEAELERPQLIRRRWPRWGTELLNIRQAYRVGSPWDHLNPDDLQELP